MCLLVVGETKDGIYLGQRGVVTGKRCSKNGQEIKKLKKKEAESETKRPRGPGETDSGDRGGVCAWPIRVSTRTATIDDLQLHLYSEYT